MLHIATTCFVIVVILLTLRLRLFLILHIALLILVITIIVCRIIITVVIIVVTMITNNALTFDKMGQHPANRGHKALDGGTLGGFGMNLNISAAATRLMEVLCGSRLKQSCWQHLLGPLFLS